MLTQTPTKAIKMVNKIKSIYLLTFTLCLLVSTFSCSSSSNSQQKNLTLTSLQIPDSLEVDTIEKVIINNKTIEIYTAYNIDKTETYEFWYKDNKQVHFVQYPIFDINYKWLVDLDGDNDIEVIRAQGYEDGVNYGIYKKNRNSEKLVLSFNPALRDERYPDKLFWGFPWDMEGIDMRYKKQILSSFQISDERDDNFSMAEKQKQMPYVFFYGKTTQPHFELKIELSFQDELNGRDITEKDSAYLIYMHLQKVFFTAEDADKKVVVKSGTALGFAGVSGTIASGTRAPHLHMEIATVLDAYGTGETNRTNPARFVKINSYDTPDQDEASKKAHIHKK